MSYRTSTEFDLEHVARKITIFRQDGDRWTAVHVLTGQDAETMDDTLWDFEMLGCSDEEIDAFFDEYLERGW